MVVLAALFMASCIRTVGPEERTLRDGLHLSSSTGELLDGKFKQVTKPDPEHPFDREHVSLLEYDDGVPVGSWSYTFGGDLIHSGEYLDEPEVKDSMKSITGCARIDLDLWKEGWYPFLSVRLIKPLRYDSVALESLEQLSAERLRAKYPHSSFDVTLVGDTLEEVYSKDYE
jgi:hypothetical protein